MGLKEMGDSVKSLGLTKDTVSKAVDALKKYAEKKGDKTRRLLEDGEIITIQLAFKKVPQIKNKIIKVKLPTSILKATSNICLFVKDLDKKVKDFEPTVKHFTSLLTNNNITSISKVIPLKELKLEYKPYEAKRNLSNMYDAYLADERIVQRLPSFLGKNFYKRKRYPVPVNLEAKNLKGEIERGLSTSMCILAGRGSTSQVIVANTIMEANDIIENVIAAVDKLSETVPGGSMNLHSLHLKSLTSPALPLYISTDSGADVVLPRVEKVIEKGTPEELSTSLDMKVLVTRHGHIQLFDSETGRRIRHPKETHVGQKGRKRNRAAAENTSTKTEIPPKRKRTEQSKTGSIKKAPKVVKKNLKKTQK